MSEYIFALVQVDTSTLLVLVVTFLVTSLYLGQVGWFECKRYPPGPWGVPLFGHLPFFGHLPYIKFAKWRKKYGDVFCIRMGIWNTVVLNGYDVIKEASDNQGDAFSSRPDFISRKIWTAVYGAEPFTLATFTPSFIQLRKIVTSSVRTFTTHSPQITDDLINQEAQNFVRKLLAKGPEPQNITLEAQYTSCSIIYKYLYGYDKELDMHSELRAMIKQADAFLDLAKNGSPVDVMPWLRHLMPGFIKRLKEVAQGNLAISRQKFAEHEKTYCGEQVRGIADYFLKQMSTGKYDALPRPFLQGALNDMFNAGFQTSYTLSLYLVLYMAEYPDVQQRVQKEIDDVIGSGRSVRLSDRPNLVYTEATILEVLRITSFAPFSLPRFTINDSKVEGYDVDRGTVALFNLHSIHHDNAFWDRPELFRPSRLVTEKNELDKAKCARILPFGIGRRRCAGEALAKAEHFIVYTTLMQRCSFERPEETVYDLIPVPGLIYSPKPYKVIVKER